MTQLQDLASVQAAVREAVETVTISDIHTHLFYPSHGDLLLWGVDELLTYHYLVAELFTIAPADLTYEKFWAMSKTEQADLIWQKVFIETGALSEACRGVITTLNRLGLDTAGRDLNSIRKWFADQDEEDYLHRVFELANLDWAIMTNNPFEPEEAGYWKQDLPKNDLLKAALRIDNLILDWENASKTMADQGYDTAEPNDKSFAQARRFLADWAKVIDPVYMAASLPPEFAYPDGGLPARIIKQVVMPTAKELNLPMAMMIGVRKRVNPPLGDAGDAVGIADVTAVNSLCIENPDAKFLVTMLSRVNQHELCVSARKFGNLHLFGCWWYCNNPSIIDEMTRQRLELLGATVTCQHSDARVLDQLVYKWHHTRKIVADVLVDKYTDLFQAGWRPTSEEISRQTRAIFGGAFENFLAK
ncbi:MAG: glucuronate isomerase [Phycisphaerae bacterium]